MPDGSTLTTEIAELRASIAELVTAVAPQLLQQYGIGPITAAQVYIAWSHPGRCRNEAAFARLAGVAPLEASSGQRTRHRLTATATEPSTMRSTSSLSPAPGPVPKPAPTSPNDQPRKKRCPQTVHRPPPLPTPRKPTTNGRNQPKHPCDPRNTLHKQPNQPPRKHDFEYIEASHGKSKAPIRSQPPCRESTAPRPEAGRQITTKAQQPGRSRVRPAPA